MDAAQDAGGWVDNLPHTIEAVFFTSTSPSWAQDVATRVHRDFNQRYPASGVPLLRLDLHDSVQPFRVV